MRYLKYINGNKVFFTGIIVKDDKQIVNPTIKQLLADGWQEYVVPEVEPSVPTYEEHVGQLIRERFSINQELAIQRQRDTNPDEFEEYFAYCEECKAKAKIETKTEFS